MNKKITSAITLVALSAVLAFSAKSVSNTKHITGDLKTGLGIITTVSDSKEATSEADGSASSEILVAAVTVNEDGVIANCYIDILTPSITFDANGTITTDASTEFVSKQVLGDSYGMAGASSIQKDWHAQVDAFAHYCIGLTAEEVLEISMNEKGQASDKDLVAGCTMYIGNFQKVVAKAAMNASEEGASADDLLGVNFVTSIAKSTNATDTKDGLAQAYVTVAAVTLNEEKVITSAVLDAVQANVNFDATGKITSDISAEVASKNELEYNYNMKGASSIQKEWFEQADAFAWYAQGKTIEEVNATPLTQGVPSEGTDLVASVTVHVTDFIEVLNKAVEIAE